MTPAVVTADVVGGKEANKACYIKKASVSITKSVFAKGWRYLTYPPTDAKYSSRSAIGGT